MLGRTRVRANCGGTNDPPSWRKVSNINPPDGCLPRSIDNDASLKDTTAPPRATRRGLATRGTPNPAGHVAGLAAEECIGSIEPVKCVSPPSTRPLGALKKLILRVATSRYVPRGRREMAPSSRLSLVFHPDLVSTPSTPQSEPHSCRSPPLDLIIVMRTILK